MNAQVELYPENDWRNYFMHSDESMKYGLPGKKKYPMPDRDHVMSAIRFFNYASPSDEKELARNIIARIEEYGITDINVGEKNRFGKYYKPEQYLQHHGVKGQKWGVKNGPPYPLYASDHSALEKRYMQRMPAVDARHLLKDIVKNYSSVNLGEWGKSKDKNILYVTGTSGSGKSTVSDKLAEKDKVQVIHLDPYLGMMSQESRDYYQNKDFNKFLKKEVPDYKDVISKDGKLNYKIVDKIAAASEKYGRQKFGKERVIIEGVQLFDETFYASRDFYKNKPVLSLKTNPIVSDWRGSRRDSEHVFETIELFAYRLPMTMKTNKSVEQFEKDLNMEQAKIQK